MDKLYLKDISIVLGTYNRFNFLRLTINSIRNELFGWNVKSEIIVIDGGSADGTIKWLTKQKDIITIIQHNRGLWKGKPIERRSWGYFMNLGFKCAQGKYICMLSDDCLIVPGSIKNGIELFETKLSAGEKIGAIAFYWRNWPEHDKYFVGITFADKMFVNHGLYLNEALKLVGYIDEKNYYFYHADNDLCLKMWEKGFKVIDSKTSFIEHYSHANIEIRNSNFSRQKEDWDNFKKKWTNIFYFEKENKTGYWQYYDYIDETNTYKYFAKNRLKKIIRIPFSNYIRSWTSSIKRIIKKSINRFFC